MLTLLLTGIWRPGDPIPPNACVVKVNIHPKVSWERVSVSGGGMGGGEGDGWCV